ncbi:hypothetical protein LJC15_02520 [Desulfovibrio sp. OttesenSCG-928-G11]|nr:hypothetical protein [Desulfovibrio sp. OttesenSCG-928-G11]
MEDDNRKVTDIHRTAGPYKEEDAERAELLAAIADELSAMTPEQLLVLKKLLSVTGTTKTGEIEE